MAEVTRTLGPHHRSSPTHLQCGRNFFESRNIISTPRVEEPLGFPIVKMRALSEEEMRVLLAKLADYMGSLKNLIAPVDDSDDSRMVFRLHAARVFYCRLSLANLATSVARDNLSSVGTCLGKFTKSGKFRLVRGQCQVPSPSPRCSFHPDQVLTFSLAYHKSTSPCLQCPVQDMGSE